MTQDVKKFKFDTFGRQNLELKTFDILGPSKIEAFSVPDRWLQDVKTFEFEVFGTQILEFKSFNLLG